MVPLLFSPLHILYRQDFSGFISLPLVLLEIRLLSPHHIAGRLPHDSIHSRTSVHDKYNGSLYLIMLEFSAVRNSQNVQETSLIYFYFEDLGSISNEVLFFRVFVFRRFLFCFYNDDILRCTYSSTTAEGIKTTFVHSSRLVLPAPPSSARHPATVLYSSPHSNYVLKSRYTIIRSPLDQQTDVHVQSHLFRDPICSSPTSSKPHHTFRRPL